MAEQWLSIVEYARRYKISDMTIRRRIKTGRLQAVLQDGKYFIPMSEIERSQQDHDSSRSSQELASRADGDLYQNRLYSNQSPARDPIQNPMTLVKGHPQPVQTQNPYQQRVQGHQIQRSAYRHNEGFPPESPPSSFQGTVPASVPELRENGVIPENLWRPVASSATAVVETKALLAYCEATVKKAMELERKTIERFKSKLESLEATIATKDLEIKSLRQQIEDMQLLVKIIERRK